MNSYTNFRFIKELKVALEIGTRSPIAPNAGHLRGLGISCSVRLVKMPLKERNFKWNYQTSQQH